MPAYANRGGNSGIRESRMGADSIEVLFKDGEAYLYTSRSPGLYTLAEMKRLAVQGVGLNSYISRVVKKNFASHRYAGAVL